MADNEPITTTHTQTPATQTPTGGDRTFTQADIDRILQERLPRAEQSARAAMLAEIGEETDVAKLKALFADAKKDREARMTEQEKLKADLLAAQEKATKAEKEQARLAAEAQEMLIKTAVLLAASVKGFHDPEDAWRHIDRSGLKVEDGKVTGADKALDELVKAKPYLTKKGGNGQALGTPGQPQQARQSGNATSRQQPARVRINL